VSGRRYRKHTKPSFEPLDPFEGLGSGDLGYRLRGGRTGFDPFEMAQEEGRFAGIVLKRMLSHPVGRSVVVILFSASVTTLVLEGAWAALALIVVIAASVLFVSAISKQDLEDIRHSRRRE
jgi:hypothetical protein